MLVQEQLYTIKQVAKHLNVSEKTVRRWVDAVSIPVLHLNGLVRFSPSQIERWKEQKTIMPKKTIS